MGNLSEARRKHAHAPPPLVLTPEERQRIYDVLESYRTEALMKIGLAANSKDLFMILVSQLRRIIVEKRIPKVMIKEVRRIARTTFEMIRDLAKDRDLGGMLDEQVAELVISDAKELAAPILPPEESFPVTYEFVPLSKIQDELARLIPNLKFLKNERDFGYKGGVARIALKLWAMMNWPERFPHSTLDAEFPVADFDAIVGHRLAGQMQKIAKAVDVDCDGIEARKQYAIDHDAILDYLSSRDLSINECLLTRDGLYFTPEALEAALTGVVTARSKRTTLFGIDWFWMQERGYLSSRAMHREVKMVVEGKSLYFELPKYNFFVYLGLYWLVLIRRWAGKPGVENPSFPDRLAKLFSCAKQLGQNFTKEVVNGTKQRVYAETPLEWLVLLGEHYKSFDFDSKRTLPQLARWIAEKWYVRFNKHIRSMFGIFPDNDMECNDATIHRITTSPPVVGDAERAEIQRVIAELKLRKPKPRWSDAELRAQRERRRGRSRRLPAGQERRQELLRA